VASGAGFASVSQSVLATIQMHPVGDPLAAQALTTYRFRWSAGRSRHVACRCAGSGTWVEAGSGHIGCHLGAPYL